MWARSVTTTTDFTPRGRSSAAVLRAFSQVLRLFGSMWVRASGQTRSTSCAIIAASESPGSAGMRSSAPPLSTIGRSRCQASRSPA